jgi:hypothetical protein
MHHGQFAEREAEKYFQDLCDRSNLGSRLIKWFEIASIISVSHNDGPREDRQQPDTTLPFLRSAG